MTDEESNDEDTIKAEEFLNRANELSTAIDDFTAILSRIEHSHGPRKSLNNDDDDDDDRRYSNHDLRGRFNVLDEFVRNHLFSQVNDHLAVTEMAKREGELRGNESQIFRDIDSDTNQSKIDSRWRNIRQFSGMEEGHSESAPTPPEAKKRLDRVLELRDEPNESEITTVPDKVRAVGDA